MRVNGSHVSSTFCERWLESKSSPPQVLLLGKTGLVRPNLQIIALAIDDNALGDSKTPSTIVLRSTSDSERCMPGDRSSVLLWRETRESIGIDSERLDIWCVMEDFSKVPGLNKDLNQMNSQCAMFVDDVGTKTGVYVSICITRIILSIALMSDDTR